MSYFKEAEPNDSMDASAVDATAILPDIYSQSVYASLGVDVLADAGYAGNYVDFYKFYVADGDAFDYQTGTPGKATLTFTTGVYNHSNIDTSLKLYDGAGHLLGSNDTAPPGTPPYRPNALAPDVDAQLSFTPLDSGWYYVEVDSHVSVQLYSSYFLSLTISGTSGVLTQSDGSSGDDYIFDQDGAGNSGDSTLHGYAGNDQIYGYEGNDTLYGDDGNDIIGGGADRDIIYGDMGPQPNLPGFNPLLTTGNDVLSGDAGDDTIYGEAGNDILEGGPGADHLDGGDDFDTATYANEASGATVDLYNSGLNAGSAVGDTLTAIEAVIGTAYADTLIGDNNVNALTGGAGKDYLNGLASADTLTGGTGDDIYVVDDVGDKVVESGGTGEGIDTVETTLASYKLLGTSIERVSYIGQVDFTGTASDADNVMKGGAGDDKFVTNGKGVDSFGGGNGTDSVIFTTSATGVVINLATGNHAGAAAGDIFGSIEKFFGSDHDIDRMTAGAGRAVFSGQAGADVLSGGANIDQLLGGAGNDRLSAGGASDLLNGGIGNDTLTGGAGADNFVYTDRFFGQDNIVDFEKGLDHIKVSKALVAPSLSGFTVSQVTPAEVKVALNDDPDNFMLVHAGGQPLTLGASDFIFY